MITIDCEPSFECGVLNAIAELISNLTNNLFINITTGICASDNESLPCAYVIMMVIISWQEIAYMIIVAYINS